VTTKTQRSLAVFVLLGVLGASSAKAHELRPAYLELRETAPDTFDALWKVPAAGEGMRLALHVRLPESCVILTVPRGTFNGGAHLARWRIQAPTGLAGERIAIDGLTSTMTDVLVRVERLDGTTQLARLTPADPSFLVEASPGRLQVVRTYLALGVEHILTGIDHLLLVLALLLIVRGRGRLVATVTAFTVAHSFTLFAATLGWVHVPGPPVEATIALSIAFVAAEVVHSLHGRPGLTARAPWIVAFGFGLLHGFGFAGALAEVGLPQKAIPLALLMFNVGVELGQLLFVMAALMLRAGLGRLPPRASWWVPRVVPRAIGTVPLAHWARLVPAYAIGCVAMFWTIQRIAAL